MLELFEEFELDEEFELLEELAEFELDPEFVPLPDVPLFAFDEELPVFVLTEELPGLVTVVCVDPGSTAATAPAAATLAKPTVAVAALSLRRPRSRSAMASETCRAARWPRGAPLRLSQLSMIAVCHP